MNSNKIFLPIILFCLLSIILISIPGFGSVIKADQIVPCGNPSQSACTLSDFLTMIGNVYHFIVFTLATPLATVAVLIGAILMMISAGNPNLMSIGKKVFWSAVIGIALVYCSYLIIQFILTAIGYKGTIGGTTT